MPPDHSDPSRVRSSTAGDAAQSKYAGYDVLTKWASPDWDDQTRAVVAKRLHAVPPIRFFTVEEAAILEAVSSRIIPQPERSADDRVPIVAWIDEKLHDDHRDGYRYEDMPPQREAWRLAIAAINETAKTLAGRGFIELHASEQDTVLAQIAVGDSRAEAWARLPLRQFFTTVLSPSIAKIYYAHPTAWSEIGYSGPASPRGHVRNWMGGVDPWDAHESKSRERTESGGS